MTAEVPVNPARKSDQSARIKAERKGTGAVLHIHLVGQRGGERVETLTMTDFARRRIIEALGGTP